MLNEFNLVCLVEKCEADSTTTPDLDETIVYSDSDTDSDATFIYDVSSDSDEEGNEQFNI